MGNFLLTASDHIIFFILGLLIPMLSIVGGKPDFSHEIFDKDSKKRLYYTNGILLWVGVFFIVLTWAWNNRSFEFLGFVKPLINASGLLFSCILVGGYVLNIILETKDKDRRKESLRKLKESTPFLPDDMAEYRHFIFAAFTAAFCEEVIFRGFFVNYVLAFSGGSPISLFTAIVLPALLFGVMHIYQGHAAVIKISMGGILFGLIFYYSQSLWIVILIHFGVDLIAGYIPIYYASEVSQEIE